MCRLKALCIGSTARACLYWAHEAWKHQACTCTCKHLWVCERAYFFACVFTYGRHYFDSSQENSQSPTTFFVYFMKWIYAGPIKKVGFVFSHLFEHFHSISLMTASTTRCLQYIHDTTYILFVHDKQLSLDFYINIDFKGWPFHGLTTMLIRISAWPFFHFLWLKDQ